MGTGIYALLSVCLVYSSSPAPHLTACIPCHTLHTRLLLTQVTGNEVAPAAASGPTGRCRTLPAAVLCRGIWCSGGHV